MRNVHLGQRAGENTNKLDGLSDKRGVPRARREKRPRSARAGPRNPSVPPRWPSEKIGEGLLWALLAFVPWPFGTVDEWSEWVVAVLVAALGLCLIKRVLFERRPFIWTWAYVPLIGLAVLAWLSTRPLPVEIVNWLAPRNVQIRQELLAHLPLAGNTQTTLSFYPPATARMLRLLVGSGIVLAAVVNFCRTPERATRMLVVLTVVGGAVAVEALLQDATGNGRIYWSIPAPVKSTSGPFVNYNNFCQFMNLAIGAGLGLLLQATWGNGLKAARGRPPLEPNAGRHVGLLMVMLVMAGMSVLLSTSRGGVLAMLAAGAVTALLLVLARAAGLTLKALALVGMGMVLLLLAWGFESFWGRMATLSDLESASGARWRVFQDVLAFVPQFAVWGIGLGNHEMVYPMFSHLGTWRNAQYVENEYLQMVEEMGFVGLALAAAFLAAIVWNLACVVRRRKTGLTYAAIGLGYGLVAVAVGSLTDFGQRLASISTVTAVVCGLIVALRKIEAPSEPAAPAALSPAAADPATAPPARRTRRGGAWRRPVFAAVMLALVAWMLTGSTRAAAAEDHWRRGLAIEQVLVKHAWQGNDEQYGELVAEGWAAVNWEPENAEYRCWLNIYRWHQALRPAAWDALTPDQRAKLFDQLLGEFQRGEILCPTYGLNYAMAGQIRYLGLRDDAGAAEIRKAYRLAPTHPAVCFIAGRLSAAEGKWEEAQDEFRHAIQLRYPREEVLAVYLNDVNRPDLAAEIFADSWDYLAALARALDKDPAQAQLAEEIRLRSQAALTAEAQKPEPSVQTLAAMADLLQRQGDLPGAVAYYRRAIDGNFGNVDWHLGLARVLARLGETAQAVQEADICLRLKPDSAAARQMLSDLATPPAPAPQGGGS